MAGGRPRERSLAEMTVDEFFEEGLSGSSDEEGELEGDKEMSTVRTKYHQSKPKKRFV